MEKKTFDRTTTVAQILADNPALIEVFDDWGLHLVPSTAVAMNAPLQKAAGWHAIRDVDKFLAELNAKRATLVAHGSEPSGNGQHGK
jgi:hypothetical protein